MTPNEMKAASRREVTSPITSTVYSIRKLAFDELTESNVNAIIGSIEQEDKPEPKGLYAIALANKMEVATRRHILEKAVLAPRIVFGDEGVVPDGALHVTWLGADAAWLAEQVLKHSGLDKASVERIEALIKNAPTPESLMPSAGDTGGSPMN